MSTDNQLAAPVWFSNSHWYVNQDGINSKETKAVVTWEEVIQFDECTVRTTWPFYLEPWPFRQSVRKEAWFDYDSYAEAFKYCVGHVAMKRWNQKAMKQYIANNPNE
jgi:hypothetical protein